MSLLNPDYSSKGVVSNPHDWYDQSGMPPSHTRYSYQVPSPYSTPRPIYNRQDTFDNRHRLVSDDRRDQRYYFRYIKDQLII